MRFEFEKVMLTVLAIWLFGGGFLWNAAPDVSTGETGEFRAADGGSKVPPPPPNGP